MSMKILSQALKRRKRGSLRGRGNNNKITQDQFSSVLGLIADSSKKHLRSSLILGDWVLDSEVGKEEWIWKMINKAVKNAPPTRATAFQEAIVKIKENEELKTKFITYVSLFLFFLFLQY